MHSKGFLEGIFFYVKYWNLRKQNVHILKLTKSNINIFHNEFLLIFENDEKMEAIVWYTTFLMMHS